MKTMKFYLAAFLLAMTTAASAQFANSNASSSMSTASRNLDTDGWQRVFVSYNPSKIVYDYDDADNLSFTAFSFGYTKGFSITKSLPLFVEAGINGLYGFKKDDLEEFEDIEIKTNIFSLYIPVNLAYKFALSNSNVTIVPFLGINFKGNIIGKTKASYNGDLGDWDGSESEYWEEMGERIGIKQETNMFDKDDVGKNATWKRFQIGWQIGVGVNFSQLYVGLSYGKDLSELCKKTKIATTSITLGYNF